MKQTLRRDKKVCAQNEWSTNEIEKVCLLYARYTPVLKMPKERKTSFIPTFFHIQSKSGGKKFNERMSYS